MKFFLSALLCILSLSAFGQSIIYVDLNATGNNDGTSWTDAYTDVQSALDDADSDTIWVAQGTYVGNYSHASSRKFYMYGGFNGTETSLSQRDWETNAVVFDGNANGSVFDFFSHAGPSSIDGCTIQNGFGSGAGIDANAADLNLANIVFQNNDAGTSNGGAVQLSSFSDFTFDNVVFTGNSASDGGALDIGSDCSSSFTNCEFTNNSATDDGGAIFNKSSCYMSNVVFSQNSSVGEGGAIYHQNDVLEIYNTVFDDNSGNGGSAIHNLFGELTASHVTFYGNQAAWKGAVYTFDAGDMDFSNCIFFGNTSVSGAADIENSSFAGTISISNSLTQTTITGGTVIETNNLTPGLNPFFYNASDPDGADDTWMTNDDGLTLTCNSPCLSAGILNANASEDITGIVRPASPNLGPYESINNFAGIIFIDADATGINDGTSWTNAFTSFQDGLSAACDGDSIWVAEGTYVGNFTKSDGNEFVLLGGFNGTETDASQRDWEANPVVLDGDSLGSVLTVISSVSNSVIDGFTLQNGAGSQAGVRIDAVDIELSNLIIQDNVSTGSNAGGLRLTNDQDITLENVQILNNSASGYGGTYVNVTNAGATLTLNNCTVSNNSNSSGFNIARLQADKVVMENTISEYNTTANGSNFYVLADTIEVNKSVFNGNDTRAGAIAPEGDACTISNCVFTDNTASYVGGAIYTEYSLTDMTLVNSTFYGNSAQYGGAYYYSENGGIGEVTNCIFRNNTATVGSYPDIDVDSYNGGGASTLNISYCAMDVMPNTPTGVTITNNLAYGTNPLFVDVSELSGLDEIWMTSDDGLRLDCASPCIAAGTSIASVSTDILGLQRGSTPDMGAYETYEAQDVFYVDIDAAGNNDGTSWSNAFTDLQDALNLTCDGDSIWVAEGTYVGSYDKNDNNEFVLLGGFDGTETSVNERDWEVHETILDGDSANTVLAIFSSVSNSVIDGFIIQNGTSTGGGIDCNADTMQFSNLLIRDNHSGTGAGGGMRLTGSTVGIIDQVTFSGNSAETGGGLLVNASASIQMTNTIFENNASTLASTGGGGIYSSSILENSLENIVFSGNSAVGDGGGLLSIGIGAQFDLVNAVFQGNSGDNGGAIYSENTELTGIHATFYNNQGNDAIITCKGNRAVTLSNFITYNNTTATEDIDFGSIFEYSIVSYSLIENGIGDNPGYVTEINNLNASLDPLFFKETNAIGTDGIWMTEDDGLRLSCASPCIDAGTYVSSASSGITGIPRPSAPNIGAYEIVTEYGIVYVDIDATGNNDGTSWTDAFTDFQEALDKVCETDTMWVAEGTYLGNFTKSDAREFVILGGFDGTETIADQRDWETNETILDGGSSGSVLSMNTLVSNSLLDGFILQNGNDQGGAIDCNVVDSVAFANLIIQNNDGDSGGGGMRILGFSSVSLTNVQFLSNTAGNGGALYITKDVTIHLENCVFESNSGTNFYGGAIFSASEQTNFLRDVVFSGNSAVTNGGAIYNSGTYGTFEIYNGLFDNNSGGDGSAIYNNIANLTGVHLTFFNNNSTDRGTVYNVFDGVTDLENCIFYQNTSANGVDDIYNGSFLGTINLTNCLTQTTITGGTVNETNNLTPGQDPLFLSESNPIGTDSVWMTEDDGLQLTCGSPAFEAGVYVASAPNGITGVSRSSTPNIGAYETFQSNGTIYVDIDAVGNNDGTSWADAYNDLQDALDNACAYDSVWVAEGTYYGGFTIQDGRDIILMGGFNGTETSDTLRDWETYATILDGGDTSRVLEMRYLTSASKVSGFILQNGYSGSGGGLYAKECGTVLYDLIFQENSTTGSGYGGAIFVQTPLGMEASNITLLNNTGWQGAAINTTAGTLASEMSFFDCFFEGNETFGNGLSAFNLYDIDSLTFDNCVFSSNIGASNGCVHLDPAGAGLYVVSNCVFENNAGEKGGAIQTEGPGVEIQNCVFANNTASVLGGAIYEYGVAQVYNSTFFKNSAPYGGAYYYEYDGNNTSRITNCIFFANESSMGTPDIDFDSYIVSSTSGDMEISYCSIENDPGTYAGVSFSNNLAYGLYPEFIDTTNFIGPDGIWMTEDDGLILQNTSPAVGTGTSSTGIAEDITGATRLDPPAIGAYESYCATHPEPIDPTVTCNDTTLYLNAGGYAELNSDDLIQEMDDNCGINFYYASDTSFYCAHIGTNTVDVFVYDYDNNIGTCSATVTIVDTMQATVLCKDTTLYLDASGLASLTDTDLDNGSSDNCSLTFSLSQTDFNCSYIGTNARTLTVTEENGTAHTCNVDITVIDTLAPEIYCFGGTPVGLDASGIAVPDINDYSFVTDNCSVVSWSMSPDTLTCANLGNNTVTFTAVDASGNTSSCTANIPVFDWEDPIALCKDTILYLDVTGTASITALELDNGSSDNCSIDTMYLDNYSFDCSTIGTNSVTFTVADAGGLAGVCTSTITVFDTIAPTAICQNATAYLDAAGLATISTGDIDAGSTDNCSIATLSLDVTSFSCADVGTNSVTLTVTDSSGNASMCSATVTVVDTIAPTVSCQDMDVYLDANGTATITAGDIDNGSTDNCSITSLTLDVTSFDCSDAGTNSVILTATDESGNQSTCIATVTVTDTTSPDVHCQDVTIYLDASGTASITTNDIDNGSTDNCAIASLSLDVTAFTCADVGTNTVTLTATDASGNQASCTSTVTVVDNTAPTAVCQNATVYLDALGSATISAGDIDGGSTDNCSIASLALDVTTFSCADAGANTVALTVMDGSGNAFMCNAMVMVIDTTAPTVSCQDVDVYLDANGTADITVGDIELTSSDNCSLTLSASQTAFDCSDIGVNAIILTATDPSGNAASCASSVTVFDTIVPTAVIQDLTVYLDASGSASVAANDVSANSSDNCAISSTVLSQTNFNCGDTGANTVVVTLTDASGNVTIDSVTVTVVDNIVPTLNCQNVTKSLSLAGTATVTSSEISPVVWDNCGTSLTLSQETFSCNDLGANTIVLTATDPSGNTNSCSTTVTIVDDLAPEPLLSTLQTIEATCEVTELTDPDVEDNCSAVTITNNATLPITASTTVLWTYEDASGNTTTQAQQITITGVNAAVTQTDDITLEAQNTTADSYQWVDCANNFAPLAGEDLYYFQPQANGKYAVIVTEGDCSDTSSCYVIDQVGINDVSTTLSDVYLVPNPTNGGVVRIESAEVLSGIEVFDLKGSKVEVEIDLLNKTINASKLASGTYMIAISSVAGTVVKRLVAVNP